MNHNHCLQGPESAKSGEIVTFMVSFVNPFSNKTLSGNSWTMNGDLKLAKDDKNKAFGYGHYKYIGGVA